MTSKVAIIISDMYNFGVGCYHDANIFPSNLSVLSSPRLRCWLEIETFRSVL